jgi:hypothetical protein
VKPQAKQRVCIRLDPAMLLEGLVLARLSSIPKAKRQEWLRVLIVQGYLWEGRVLHRTSDATTRPHSSAHGEERGASAAAGFGNWPARSCTLRSWDVLKQADCAPAEPVNPFRSTSRKRFAHLRKVIG